MRKRQYNLVCEVCSVPFLGYHQTNKYCSSKCSQKSDKRKQYTKEYAAERRKLIQDYKIKVGCCLCGYNKHPEALDFDHIDPSTKDFCVSQDMKRKLEDTIKEIEKCRVLCKNCHAVETIKKKHHANRT